MDERNFIGLIHGLMPVISPVSTGAATAATDSPPTIIQPPSASTRSRRCSSRSIAVRCSCDSGHRRARASNERTPM